MAFIINGVRSLFRPEGAKKFDVPPLPKDVVSIILANLEDRDLARASKVCKTWNAIVLNNGLIRRRLFNHLPEPLGDYLASKEPIPTLVFKGTAVPTDTKKFEELKINVGTRFYQKIVYDLPVTPEMMTAPVMFVKEPWKRAAFAIRYQVTFQDGKEGNLVVVLHEVGKHRPGVWRCTQEMKQSKGVDFERNPLIDTVIKTVRVSTLFRNGWEKNEYGEFDYLRRLLKKSPCGPIQITQRTDQPSVYEVCEPEDDRTIIFKEY